MKTLHIKIKHDLPEALFNNIPYTSLLDKLGLTDNVSSITEESAHLIEVNSKIMEHFKSQGFENVNDEVLQFNGTIDNQVIAHKNFLLGLDS